MKVFRRFIKGILLKGESSDPTDNQEGSVWTNSTTSRIKSYIEGAVRTLVSEDQTQTLTNKSIDADNNPISNVDTTNLRAGVLNTSTTLTGASDTQIPSALATKTYVDDSIATKDEASEISYDNTTSGLAATDVQAATDEVEGRVDTLETDISGKADTDLNNLASVDLNQNLTTTKASALQLSHTTVNQDVDVLTANNGAGDSGDINLTPGTATGTRGDINLLGEQKSTVNINSPIWWATSGIPGITLDLTTTAATNAFAAAIVAEGTSNDADFFIGTQDQTVGTAGSANMYITTGWNSNTGNTGNLELYSGNQSGASGNSGDISITTGSSANGNSGPMFVRTGTANNGNSGAYSLTTGNSISGITGDINLTTGFTAGTRGEINLNTSKVDMTAGTELDVTGITITGLAGSSVANTPSGNLAATDVQAALNELQTELDSAATDADLTAHITDAVDAHDASAISNVPAGNLAATDIQAAVNELQSDIDTRATAAALNGHLDGGVSKHDATEIDYERLDGSKKNIQAASDDAEAALTDLDDAIGALDATPTNYTPTSAAIVADHLSAIDTALASAGGGATTELDNLGTTAVNAVINMGTNKIAGMGEPTLAQDAATKNYVDTNTIPDAPSDGTPYARQDAGWVAANGTSLKLFGGGNIELTSPISNSDIYTVTATNSNLGMVNANFAYGQSFVPVSTSDIQNIQITMNKGTVSVDADVEMEIYDDSGGFPNALVATADNVIAASAIGLTNGSHTFNFTGANLTAGATYYFTIKCINIVTLNSTDRINVVASLGNEYATGGRISSVDGGSSWGSPSASQDLVGIINADVTGAPELSFDADLFVEKAGLDYSDNTIPTSESPLTFTNDNDVAYVVPNQTAPGSNLSVTVDTLDNVPSNGVVIARRIDSSVTTTFIGDTTKVENDQTKTLYQDSTGLPTWKKVTVAATAFTAAATTEDIELLSLPAGAAIHSVVIKHSVRFDDNGNTAFTLSVGVSGDLTKYASAFDVWQNPGNTIAQTTSVFDVEDFGSATSIRLAAVSTGQTLDNVTLGSVDVYVLMSTLPV